MLALFVLAVVAALPQRGHAQALSLIRDAEIENILETYLRPLTDAAGYNSDYVKIFIVDDPQLNAFVAGGPNIFLTTGLLMRAENPDQVIGVMAHELGHITGGHLARTQEFLENASTSSLIAMVLGLGAAVMGAPDALPAVLSAGSHVAQRSFLSHSRVQESAADQAAFRVLDAAGYSAKGMLEFFKILENQELMMPGNQDPYLRTHPLTQDRIAAVAQHVRQAAVSDKNAAAPDLLRQHARMRAKLVGFLLPIDRVFNTYRAHDRAVPARYARAVAYYRDSQIEEALVLMDGLIADHPKDPYFHELKGQILFENARLETALTSYEKALALLPGNNLVRLNLARVQLELNNPAMVHSAMLNLEEVSRHEPENAAVWYFLAIAYGRDGQMGMAALSQAEHALLVRKPPEAIAHAQRAIKQLEKDSPAMLRAKDIQRTATLAAERSR